MDFTCGEDVSAANPCERRISQPSSKTVREITSIRKKPLEDLINKRL
ncbi:hypothetical protein [Gardnerella vaginalis]